MPHSSGGGSHSSGGSSHHSGSSGHSSHNSSSSTSIRKNYFQGSSRYVYYNHRRPVYFYSDKSPENMKFSVTSLVMKIFLYCPFIAVGLFMIIISIGTPTMLNGAKDTNIIINDELSIIDNTQQLKTTLKSFADETGIIPMVATVSNEEWKSHYDSLEAYAYDKYLNMCDDEYHWLIVYSQPKSPDKQFNDWHWHGM